MNINHDLKLEHCDPARYNITEMGSFVIHTQDAGACDYPPHASLVTEAEYWQYYYENSNYEWNNGHLELKSVSDHLTLLIYHWFTDLLRYYLLTNPIAHIIDLEFGFRLTLPTGTTIRKPDTGIVLHNNPVALKPLDRSYQGICDMCIEALSNSTAAERKRDLVQKKHEYAAAGVREYFVLHHETRYCVFYTLSPKGHYVKLKLRQGVIHSRVLPGFKFRPSDLWERPELNVLRQDPLYRDFVLPGWHKEELLRQKAEDQVKLLLSQLRGLGVDPNL